MGYTPEQAAEAAAVMANVFGVAKAAFSVMLEHGITPEEMWACVTPGSQPPQLDFAKFDALLMAHGLLLPPR